MAKDTSLTFSLYGKDVSASDSIKKVGKQSESLGQQFSKMGKVAGASLLAVGVAASALATQSIKNAIEDEKSQRRLAISLKNTVRATKAQTASVEDYISKTQARYGIVDDKLRPSLQRLVTATKDVTKAQELQTLAINVSAGTGKDLETVSNAIAKAYGGNLASLQRLGLGLDATVIKSKDTKKAFEILSTTFSGQAAGAADSLEGRFGRLKIAVDETKEQIGFALLPIVEKMAIYLTDTVVPNVQGFVDGLTGVKNKGGEAATSAFNFGEKVKGVIKWIGDNNHIIKTFASLVAGIFVGIKTAAIISALSTLGGAFLTLTGIAATTAGAEAAATGGASLAIAAPAIAAIAATFGAATLLGLTGIDPGNPEDDVSNETPAEIRAREKAKAKARAAKAKAALASGSIYIYKGQRYTWDAKKKQYWFEAMGSDGTYHDYSNPHPKGAPMRAVGGSVMGRTSYYVGENGPELFTPSTSGRITPNGLGGGSGMRVVVNVHGSVVQEKDLAVTVRDNIAQLMRRQGLNPNILGV